MAPLLVIAVALNVPALLIVLPAAFVRVCAVRVRAADMLMPVAAVDVLVSVVIPEKSPPDTINVAVPWLVNALLPAASAPVTVKAPLPWFTTVRTLPRAFAVAELVSVPATRFVVLSVPPVMVAPPLRLPPFVVVPADCVSRPETVAPALLLKVSLVATVPAQAPLLLTVPVLLMRAPVHVAVAALLIVWAFEVTSPFQLRLLSMRVPVLLVTVALTAPLLVTMPSLPRVVPLTVAPADTLSSLLFVMTPVEVNVPVRIFALVRALISRLPA